MCVLQAQSPPLCSWAAESVLVQYHPIGLQLLISQSPRVSDFFGAPRAVKRCFFRLPRKLKPSFSPKRQIFVVSARITLCPADDESPTGNIWKHLFLLCVVCLSHWSENSWSFFLFVFFSIFCPAFCNLSLISSYRHILTQIHKQSQKRALLSSVIIFYILLY